MPRYEYKVVPTPSKGLKGKGVRGAEARFSFAVQELMNGMAGYGWEYQRAETLPSIERSGLVGTTTEWRNVLIFHRLREGDAQEFQPELLPAPSTTETAEDQAIEMQFENENASEELLPDNGVEDTEADSSIGASLNILARARNGAKPPEHSDSEKAAKPDA